MKTERVLFLNITLSYKPRLREVLEEQDKNYGKTPRLERTVAQVSLLDVTGTGLLHSRTQAMADCTGPEQIKPAYILV